MKKKMILMVLTAVVAVGAMAQDKVVLEQARDQVHRVCFGTQGGVFAGHRGTGDQEQGRLETGGGDVCGERRDWPEACQGTKSYVCLGRLVGLEHGL